MLHTIAMISVVVGVAGLGVGVVQLVLMILSHKDKENRR